jgi:threonine synthase
MKYISVNHQSPAVSFQEALFAGIAPDGGLYVPEIMPRLSETVLNNIDSLSLTDIGYEILKCFIDDIPEQDLKKLVESALQFPIPLIKLTDKIYLLELFHGPTLAFKDVGARFMAQVMSYYLKKQQREIRILVATSGDTGSAVAHGFYRIPHVSVYILYPSGKVSPLQEKQITTLGDNIHSIEVLGTFDDCQRLVKESLADKPLVNQFHLTTANSINMGRLLPQIIYYAWAVIQWRRMGFVELPNVVVPSGNFGNITACAYAKHLGIPMNYLIAATNANDVVPQYFETGEFKPRPSQATVSNAMDVGNPSNFFRLQALYDFNINKMRQEIATIAISDDITMDEIKQTFDSSHVILDPHTAVGVAAARQMLSEHQDVSTMIVASTAHPAKFVEVVEKAIQIKIPLPPALATALSLPKRSLLLSSSDFESWKKLLNEIN